MKKIIKKIKKWFTLPFRCKYCGRAFDTKRGLNVHITRMHKEEE